MRGISPPRPAAATLRLALVLAPALALALPAAPLAGQEFTVKGGLAATEVMLGQANSFQVQVDFRGSFPEPRFILPEVEGIVLGEPRRVSQRQFLFNGRGSGQYIYQIPITATRVGIFEIPAWGVVVGGRRHTLPAARLTVEPLSDEVKGRIFVRLETPRDHLYVGEKAECSFKLYLRSDIAPHENRLWRIPRNGFRRDGDDFIMSELPENPGVTTEQVGGTSYQVRSWPVTVTAVKQGRYPLLYQIDVIYPGGLQLALFNEENAEMTVRPLPAEGKPEKFGGAVGAFELSSNISNPTVAVGEAVKLTLDITGRGNFDRIQSPVFEEAPGLKIYPPKRSDEPGEGAAGSVSFAFTIIPEDAAVRSVPPASFSFFNPGKGVYETLRTRPFPVLVEGAPAPGPAGAPVASAAGGGPGTGGAGGAGGGDGDLAAAAAGKGPAIRGKLNLNVVVPGPWFAHSSPAFTRPFFYLAQLLPLALVGGALLYRKHQLLLQEGGAYARRFRASRSVRRWLASAAEASSRGDALAFYAAAQRALQESVGKHFENVSTTLTADELDAALADRGAPDDLRREVAAFCRTAEALKFAPSGAEVGDLADRQRVLTDLVARAGAL